MATGRRPGGLYYFYFWNQSDPTYVQILCMYKVHNNTTTTPLPATTCTPGHTTVILPHQQTNEVSSIEAMQEYGEMIGIIHCTIMQEFADKLTLVMRAITLAETQVPQAAILHRSRESTMFASQILWHYW